MKPFLPRDRFQQAIFAGFFVFLAASCVAPPYPDFLLMQHVPTLFAAGLLAYVANRFVLSCFSFAAIVLFLMLHTLGARYLYSYTPYDTWSLNLFGASISGTFGFERNHYDRLVHFSYGVLLVLPVREFELRYLKLTPTVASVLALECILATSAAYELLEWLVAVVFTPEWADTFLGQQGDIFDAQKDTASAMLGAVLSLGVMKIMSCRD